MSDFISQTVTDISALASVIGEENVEDVKRRIADIIVKSVQDDVDQYRSEYYSFYPPEYIEGIADDAFEEVKTKIKKMYKGAMLEVAQKAVENFKEQTGLKQREGE